MSPIQNLFFLFILFRKHQSFQVIIIKLKETEGEREIEEEKRRFEPSTTTTTTTTANTTTTKVMKIMEV